MSSARHTFYQLTPDMVIAAAEQAGFSPSGHLLALNSLENRVFDARLDNGKHIVLKFYRPGRYSRQQICEEHSFIAELDQAEIPVCRPLLLPSGCTVAESSGIYYAIWPRTGGRMAEELDEENMARLGALLARIHNVGAAKSAGQRPVFDTEKMALEPLLFLEQNNFLPGSCREEYRFLVGQIAAEYNRLARGVPVHRIHGDCHKGNLLHVPDGWFFLDFDDFVTGPAVQDMWMLLPPADSEGLYLRSVMADAYRQFRDFDDAWFRLVEPLRALRFIHYSAWIARRWEDPSFVAAFPHFGSEDYWQNETRDLRRQLQLIQTGDGLPPQPQEELSNADFFWDMAE